MSAAMGSVNLLCICSNRYGERLVDQLFEFSSPSLNPVLLTGPSPRAPMACKLVRVNVVGPRTGETVLYCTVASPYGHRM